MNTVQEEEEIKYIPEGAKCKSHVGLRLRLRLHYQSTGAQEKISTADRISTYSSFRKLFPLKKTYPSYSLGRGSSQGNTGSHLLPSI